MPQQNGVSDVRLVFINGYQLPGLANVNEQGYDMDSIEVPEQGYTALIASGQKKTLPLEVTYIVKRDSKTLKYFKDWDKSGGDARDIQMLHTDKSGNPLNAYARSIYSQCELGPIKWPDFDQASRKFANLKITLFPYKPAEYKTLT
ncbi:hypothetical protein EHQ53_14005 [Leptospira langatensis]|uniref:Uncharacterized protein n=1 Tax=Leptospira langatensis TaxID=2484983 RepID=A0ABY2M971_9LEPT|nr:hypothetical protein [Leptospira langatensis]TGL39631.1 hypothetical protein EHQ53_14005 [Leptospira langatensis]